MSFTGLTETMSERSMREGLLWYPIVAIFKVGDNWVNLPAVPGGRGFNAQGNFGDGYAYGKNGQVYHIAFHMQGEDETAFLKRTPGVATGAYYEGYAIRARDNCAPLINTVIFYSEQIADLMSALANCTPLMHHPIALQANQKQRATAIKWYKEMEQNIPFIFTPPVNDSSGRLFQAEPVNLLANGDIVKPTVELLDWFNNQCLTEIGVTNMGSQVDKKGENLTTDEIHGTDEVTNIVVDNQVNLINQQIKELHINEIEGLENFRAQRGHEDGTNDTGEMDGDERDDMADNTSDNSEPE